MSSFGEVKSHRLTTVEAKNKKVGFVDFTTIEQAIKAVEDLDQSCAFGEDPIEVKFFQAHNHASAFRQRWAARTCVELMAARHKCLWVCSLPPSTTDESLYQLFSPFGKITRSKVFETAPDESRQFGFVCLEKLEDANAALGAMNGKILPGSKDYLIVSKFRSEHEGRILYQQLILGERSRCRSIHSSSSCLYVADLNPHTPEEDLSNVFSQFGTIVSVKIPPRTDGKSLGYAYINFKGRNDAFKAEESCHLLRINGKPCRIMFAESHTSRQNNLATLFIKGLHPNIDSNRLENLFSPYGTIISCKLKTDDEGKSQGYAYIQFDTYENAVKSIEAMNGKEVGSIEEPEERCTISVRHHQPANLFVRMVDGIRPQTNVYVKNLPIEVTDESFLKIMSSFGEVKSHRLTTVEPKNKKVGFVDFTTIEQAIKAVRKLNQSHAFGEDPIEVNFFQPKTPIGVSLLQEELRKSAHLKEASKHQSLWVGSLPPSTTDESLYQLFSPFGKITRSNVFEAVIGERKKFGFVCFEKSEDANVALGAMSGKSLVGSKDPLILCNCRTKLERKILNQQLEHPRCPSPKPNDPLGQTAFKKLPSANESEHDKEAFIKLITEMEDEEEETEKLELEKHNKIPSYHSLTFKIPTSIPKTPNAFDFEEQRNRAKQDGVFALLKEIKRLLNKLSESNKVKIFSSIVEIFNRQHPCSRSLSDELFVEFKKEFTFLLFIKAVLEPSFSNLYIQLSVKLSKEFPGFSGYFIAQCQSNFEKFFVKDSEEFTKLLAQGHSSCSINEELTMTEAKLKVNVLGIVRFIVSLILHSVIPAGVASTVTKQLVKNFQKPFAIEGLLILWTKLLNSAAINEFIEKVVAKQISDFSTCSHFYQRTCSLY
ncbi:hypothetical protein GEMRC1_002531 [Eukaryota sp. GEM-RC1]